MTSTQLYKNWNVKLNIPPTYIGCHKLSDRVSTSCGLPMLNKLLGKKRVLNILERINESKDDIVIIKLRNGGKLRFYAK